jgi:hypothetical protein
MHTADNVKAVNTTRQGMEAHVSNMPIYGLIVVTGLPVLLVPDHHHLY